MEPNAKRISASVGALSASRQSDRQKRFLFVLANPPRALLPGVSPPRLNRPKDDWSRGEVFFQRAAQVTVAGHGAWVGPTLLIAAQGLGAHGSPGFRAGPWASDADEARLFVEIVQPAGGGWGGGGGKSAPAPPRSANARVSNAEWGGTLTPNRTTSAPAPPPPSSTQR